MKIVIVCSSKQWQADFSYLPQSTRHN